MLEHTKSFSNLQLAFIVFQQFFLHFKTIDAWRKSIRCCSNWYGTSVIEVKRRIEKRYRSSRLTKILPFDIPYFLQ